MANKTDKTNLGYLGEDFQYKLVHAFLEDKEFFKDLYEITDQNMFTNPNLKTCVGIMKEYFEKHESVPSYDTIAILLREKITNSVDLDVYCGELGKLKETSFDDIDMVKEMGTRFFRQQNIVKTANLILKIASNGVDEDKCAKYVELMNEALTKGIHNDYGLNITDDIDDTLSADYRQVIPTGIDVLDEVLEGGIGKGELGLIVGPTSFGKTSLTTAMASHAAIESNKKVLQIFFEDTVKQIRRKHIARFVTKYGDGDAVEARNLSRPDVSQRVYAILNKEENKEKIQRLRNNLRLKRIPSGEITTEGIKRFIKKLMMTGFTPDLVIVDYFECLNHDCFSAVANEYDKEGKSMRKMEAMVGEMNIAMWIPSQGTKDSVNLELVTMDKIGGSAKKSQIAHIILSIARSTEDIGNNKATLAVLKNRAGQSGKVFEQADFNNGTCIISADENSCESSSLLNFNKKTENKLMSAIYKNI